MSIRSALKFGWTVAFFFGTVNPCISQAEIAQLRSVSREIRFGLGDHGHSLNLAERKAIRKDLALTYLALAKYSRERRGSSAQTVPPPGRSLISLATAVQRLIESTPRQGLSAANQSQLERQLAHASLVLRSKLE